MDSVSQPKVDNSSEEVLLEQPKRILIVNDDYDSIKPFEGTLSQYGCYVQIATDGIQAVELLTDTPYDLVFLDWVMPKLEGGETIEAAERCLELQEDFYWYERMPIV